MPRDYEQEFADLTDAILDLLTDAGADGVELNPLAVIMQRLAARGETVDVSDQSPLMQMLLAGMDT